ncbi:hypothetical protein ACFQER_08825 [Halomicroarcula sp. GCM10025894]|uniref:hypothetical protein n=1 Tax=Halomicroarcula sp. GCM10025894 TaxID=3252673 RepID=UPI00360FEE78
MSATDEDAEEEAGEEEEIQRGSLVTQSLPHNYEREAIGFDVEEFLIDGEPLDERGELDADERFLSLVDESGWHTLTITGTVTLESETIQEVFPPDEWDSPAGRLVLVKTNPLAIHRSRRVLKEPPVEDGIESFEVDIERSEHRGTVKLEPFLTRASGREAGATNCASKAGSRLSNGLEWSIQLDEPNDGGGLLMPIIEDFEDNDKFPNENHIHYLSLDEPQNPQLYLNRGHPQVVKVLENEGATGALRVSVTFSTITSNTRFGRNCSFRQRGTPTRIPVRRNTTGKKTS